MGSAQHEEAPAPASGDGGAGHPGLALSVRMIVVGGGCRYRIWSCIVRSSQVGLVGYASRRRIISVSATTSRPRRRRSLSPRWHLDLEPLGTRPRANPRPIRLTLGHRHPKYPQARRARLNRVFKSSFASALPTAAAASVIIMAASITVRTGPHRPNAITRFNIHIGRSAGVVSWPKTNPHFHTRPVHTTTIIQPTHRTHTAPIDQGQDAEGGGGGAERDGGHHRGGTQGAHRAECVCF